MPWTKPAATRGASSLIAWEDRKKNHFFILQTYKLAPSTGSVGSVFSAIRKRVEGAAHTHRIVIADEQRTVIQVSESLEAAQKDWTYLEDRVIPQLQMVAIQYEDTLAVARGLFLGAHSFYTPSPDKPLLPLGPVVLKSWQICADLVPSSEALQTPTPWRANLMWSTTLQNDFFCCQKCLLPIDNLNSVFKSLWGKCPPSHRILLNDAKSHVIAASSSEEEITELWERLDATLAPALDSPGLRPDGDWRAAARMMLLDFFSCNVGACIQKRVKDNEAFDSTALQKVEMPVQVKGMDLQIQTRKDICLVFGMYLAKQSRTRTWLLDQSKLLEDFFEIPRGAIPEKDILLAAYKQCIQAEASGAEVADRINEEIRDASSPSQNPVHPPRLPSLVTWWPANCPSLANENTTNNSGDDNSHSWTNKPSVVTWMVSHRRIELPTDHQSTFSVGHGNKGSSVPAHQPHGKGLPMLLAGFWGQSFGDPDSEIEEAHEAVGVLGLMVSQSLARLLAMSNEGRQGVMQMLVFFSCQAGRLDSRMDTALARTAQALNIDLEVLWRWQDSLSLSAPFIAAMTQDLQGPSSGTEDDSGGHQTSGKGKGWKVAGAAIAGGALVFATGGAALPAFQLSAMAAAGGVFAVRAATSSASEAANAMAERLSDGSQLFFRPLGQRQVSRARAGVCISGWLSDDEEPVTQWDRAFKTSQGNFFKNREWCCLRWEVSALRSLSILLPKGPPSKSGTVFALATSGIRGVMRKAADGVTQDTWGMVSSRANRLGQQLAQSFIKADNGKPLTLIGFGYGAEVIYSCLKKLAEFSDSEGLVQHAFLIGAPVSSTSRNWETLRSVVSGRLVSAYHSKDSALDLRWRLTATGVKENLPPAGAIAIQLVGVENVDLSSKIPQARGQFIDYREHLPAVLNAIGIEEELI